MRALRVLGVLAALLAVLAAAGAWIVPGELDWSRYRRPIEGFVSAALGRPVGIGGEVRLSVLPEPELIARDVRIGEGDAAVVAGSIRLRVALLPLFAGRLEPREIVLAEPRLRLPWPLPAATLPRAPPSTGEGLRLRLAGGTLEIGRLAVDRIDLMLTAGGAAGGFDAEGTALLFGRRLHLTARLTDAGADGSAGLTVTVADDGGMSARLSGQIDAEGEFAGQVRLTASSFATLLPGPAVPFEAEGRLTFASGLAAADALALSIGGVPGQGAVALRLTPALRLDLALAASRLDLDAWLQALGGGSALPFPVGLDLSAEAATLRGGALRRLRAAFDVTGDGLTVRSASAILPGEATIQGSAHLAASGALRGSAKLAAPDLHATLRWLDPELARALPDTVWHGARLGFRFGFTRDGLTLSDLDGSLDATRVTGMLSLTREPALVARLAFDQLALDPFLAAAPPPVALDLVINATRADVGGVAIDGFRLDAARSACCLALHALRGRVGGVAIDLAGAVDPDGRITDGHLALDGPDAAPLVALAPRVLAWPLPEPIRAGLVGPVRLDLRAAGPPASLDVKATAALGPSTAALEGTADLAARQAHLTLRLADPDAAALAARLGKPELGSWFGSGPLAVKSGIELSPVRFGATALAVDAGTLHATGTLGVSLSVPEPMLDGDISLAGLALPLPAPGGAAPLPLLWARGWHGRLGLAVGTLRLGALPPLSEVATTLRLAEGRLSLEHLTAWLGGGALDGEAVLETGSAPPSLHVTARLADAHLDAPAFGLPLDPASGTASVRLDLAARGYAPATLLATLTGRAEAALRDGVIDGVDLASVAAAVVPGPQAAGRAIVAPDAAASVLSAALAGGRTAFTSLDLAARIEGGRIGFDRAELAALFGRVTLAGGIDLPAATLDLHATVQPNGGPPIELDFTGPLAAPQRLTDLAALARWRAGQERP